MRWKTKATIQQAISLLPSGPSYAAYYWLQRQFGSLRRVNPIGRLRSGVETWDVIERAGREPKGKSYFEVGTGRLPLAPIALWLMGADRVLTVDVNPYVREDLLRESLEFILLNKPAIRELFGERLVEDRFAALNSLTQSGQVSLADVLRLCRITYVAPGDAAQTSVPSGSVDVHTSYTVFEHIPASILRPILRESRRLIAPDGILAHRIDYSDHFAHSDDSISLANFLQFDSRQWDRLAGNRYMYMNRLRDDDYLALFREAGFEIALHEPDVDQRSLELLLRKELRPDASFEGKAPSVLATVAAWIVAEGRSS